MPTIADRERLLRELAAANVAVGSEASLEDVLQKTAEVAARLVNARYAALGVLDRTGSHLERLITTGIDEATRARIGDLPSDHGVLRVLLREARPVRVADVTTEQHFFGFPPAHPQMRSFLGVPIFVRGVVYGDLYLAEKEGGEFTEGDEEIVTLLAAQTGLTIEKVQIHEGATHWIRQLEVLDELTRSVLEERDVSRLLELVARRLRELVGARAVLISLPASSGGLRVAVADGDGVADVVGYDIPSESKHARALARGKSERVDALLADPEVDQVLAGRVGGVTALLIPLIFRERAIGIISAFNKSGLTPASLTMTFASAKHLVHAPRSPFTFRNASRAKRSTRSSKRRKPSGAGSLGSYTTRRAPRSPRSSSVSRRSMEQRHFQKPVKRRQTCGRTRAVRSRTSVGWRSRFVLPRSMSSVLRRPSET